MSVLSDVELRRLYPESRSIGPASIDLHIGSVLWFWPDTVARDPRTDQSDIWRRVPLFGTEVDDQTWILTPGLRYLSATQERIRILPDLAGQISARSSWGRDGLAVICGPAGWLDPGFVGNVVLELSVIGSELVIWPGASIAQLILHRLTEPCRAPYSGRYQEQDGVVPSRFHLEGQR